MKIKFIVRDILLMKPETRNSDHRLYAEYIKKVKQNPNAIELIDCFINPKKNGLVSFESVSRARRRLQEEDRESGEMLMQSKKQIERERRNREREFRQLYSANYKFAEERWTEE